jgi:putative endonuclease
MTKAHQLGRWGEQLAGFYLEQCGHTCLARQMRRPGGEIDLVTEFEGCIVFVEVKTRGRGACASPEVWVDSRKLHRMRRVARYWIHENQDHQHHGYRFDVVAIEFKGEGHGFVVRHFAGVI